MTRNDIIRMAREAGVDVTVEEVFNYQPQHSFVGDDETIGRFVRLIEKHLSYDGIHTCNDECQRPVCVAIRKAVEREREACAKVADLVAREIDDTNGTATYIAAAIRTRGNQ
jgi:hypothetical protein